MPRPSLPSGVRVFALVASAGAAVPSAGVHAQSATPDFSVVTALAEGAVIGQNVDTPVPGFELILLRDGVEVYHRSFGAWSTGRLANADSATKTLSGALIMSLVDSSPNPFTLQTRLSQYLPEYTGAKSVITIAQCFSHTAGMFGNSTAVGDESITLRQAAAQIAQAPLRFSPGMVFSYGGVSMHAAGAAAEVAGGAPWNTMFQQRIAGPLGFTQTRYTLSSPQNPRIAGGAESTGDEFGRFMEMLRRGGVHQGTRVLSEAAVRTLLTRQTATNIPVNNSPILSENADYGVGIWLDQRGPNGELLGAIAAGARGFSSWIDFDDRLVGVFATDLSASGNVQPLLYLLRDAAQAAVRAADCPADFNLDGVLNPDDLADFVDAYFSPGESARIDFNHDGVIDPDDLSDFIVAYFERCAD